MKIEHNLLDKSTKSQNIEKDKNTGDELTSWAETNRQIELMKDVGTLSAEDFIAKKIIYPGMRNKTLVNRFRDLRTKLLQQSDHQNFITLVTALYRGCGTSFVSINLSAAFAFDQGKTAILIDCNLRDYSSSRILERTESIGLTDFLEKPETPVESIIHPTGINRLRMLPVGNRKESYREFFTSLGMRRLVSHIKGRYPDRYPIIDAPPILESADAEILTEFADKIILVIPYGKITEGEINTAIDKIGRAKFAGIVFNNEPA